MKSIKIIAMCVLTLLSVQMFAQGKKGGKKAERVQKELGLSDKQMNQVKSIRMEMKSKMKAVRQNENLSKEERKAQMKEIRTHADNSMRGVLNTEQYQKYQEMKEEHKRKRRQGTKGQKGKKGKRAQKPVLESTDQ